MRNLYWDGQISKKLSVLKPQRLRNLRLIFIFSIIILKTHVVTNFDKNILRKES